MELKKYRRIAGLTQRGLADKSGVDVTLISRLERGARQTASYESIVRLARALNLEPEELVAVGLRHAPPVTDDAKGAA
jgi:transcriptional regulator with XRE-family HTH domain